MNKHICVIGMQQGDEGKGKIVDALSENVQAVARFQGGGNAGHTVHVHGQKYVLHHIPTGILHDKVIAIIGNGMVIEPNQFMEEFNLLTPDQQSRVYLSDRAHLTTARLLNLDIERETTKGATIIGTCRRGIGPTYESKYARTGIRLGDLHRGFESFAPEDQEILKKFYDVVGPQICDTTYFLHNLDADGATILFEGAQGVLLDIDFGAYPFCTSSHCTAMGVGIGTGFSPRKIGRVIGVAKVYPTKIGTGPFPSMANSEDDEMLRQKGNEFGATTGRPRKCGWLDIPAMRYAIKVGDIDEIALTKVDILTGLEKIPVCVAYKVPGMESCDGTDYYPTDTKILEQVEPVWEYWKGWASVDNLANLEIFIRRLETALNRPITMIGCGPNRDDIIYR
jgi:adenylosuccinate synthase